jgi:hypothetical protein
VRRPDLRDHRAELRVVLAMLAFGVVVGILWRVLTPVAVRHSDPREVLIARDGALALLNLGAGVLTGLFSQVRPGRAVAVRTSSLLLGSLLGAFLAWPVGLLLGVTGLGAIGIVLIWPVLAAIMMFAGAVLPLGRRDR